MSLKGIDRESATVAMRVDSFRVLNYRSITSAEVPLRDMTALVGANNEGKSNILRALVLGMGELLGNQGSERRPLRRRAWGGMNYDPRKDISQYKPSATPRVEIRLQLDDAECDAFHQAVGHRINGELRFRIDFPSSRRANVQVIKQRSGPALTDKTEQIAMFVRERLRVEYIPAIRTADQALGVIERLVLDQLALLRRDPVYTNALNQIRELEQPLLDQIAADVTSSLAEFLPDVSAVQIVPAERPASGLYRPLRESIEILVDDGVSTDLAAKGDGVQSLAAIAIMRRAAAHGTDDQHLVLAIEEPETHLHPSAIRRLRSVLREISQDQQVVLTTHSPLLIDTEKPDANVVVMGNQAKPARLVREVRECLGVEVSDNLVSARLVLLVEGANDARIVRAVLRAMSERLRDLLERGELVLEPLGSASKLSAHASAMRSSACSIYAILDGDDEGRSAIDRAVGAGRLALSDYRLVNRAGLTQAELEDLVLVTKARSQIESELGLTLNVGAFSKGGPKFSEKLVGQLRKQGKLGSERETGVVKRLIAESVEADPLGSLRKEGRVWFSDLAATLEGRLV